MVLSYFKNLIKSPAPEIPIQSRPPWTIRIFVPIKDKGQGLYPKMIPFYLESYDNHLDYSKILNCICKLDEDLGHEMWHVEHAMDTLLTLSPEHKALFYVPNISSGMNISCPFPIHLKDETIISNIIVKIEA